MEEILNEHKKGKCLICKQPHSKAGFEVFEQKPREVWNLKRGKWKKVDEDKITFFHVHCGFCHAHLYDTLS